MDECLIEGSEVQFYTRPHAGLPTSWMGRFVGANFINSQQDYFPDLLRGDQKADLLAIIRSPTFQVGRHLQVTSARLKCVRYRSS